MLYRDDIEERRIRREENRRRRRKQERIRRMILGGLTAVIGIAVIATAVLVTKRLIGRKQVDPADVADAYYAACVMYPQQFQDIDPVEKAGEIFTKLLGSNPYHDLEEAGYAFCQITIGA